MSDIVEWLRSVLNNDRSVELRCQEAANTIEELTSHIEDLVTKCEQLQNERDEARRLWCMAVEEIESGMTNDTRYEVAESKGWDCFNTPKSNVVKTLNGVVSEVKKSEPPKFDSEDGQ